MSNVNSPSALHGVDDEFDRGGPSRCASCWRRAKQSFFSSPRRSGVTLESVYTRVFVDAHSDGNRY